MACNCNEQGNTINIGMGCCVPIVANADAYYTKSEIDEKLDDIVISGGGITSGEVQSMIDKSISGYVSTSEFTQYIQNLQDQITQLQIEISGCCSGGSGETWTRWITMTGDNDYSCSGTTKYTKEKEQTSTDLINWVDTGNYRQGSTVIEENSVDCGYIPEIFKWKATYSDETVQASECDASSAIAPSEINLTNLVNVEIGDCVTIIGGMAFYHCSGLKRLNSDTDGVFIIPDNVTSIGSNAFDGCDSLTSCTIGSGVTSIASRAFYGCSSLSSITIPDSVTSIGEYAFATSHISGATLGSGITSISDGLFASCDIKKLNYSFNDEVCKIPNTVTSIGNNAFRYNKFRIVDIYNSVTSIGNYAFFTYGNDWRYIHVYSTTPPTLGTDVFGSNIEYLKIYVPEEAVAVYKEAWPQYSSVIVANY